MNTMQIGFIGYGEAAFEISYGLKNEGVKNIAAFDPLWTDPDFSPLIRGRAKKADVDLLSSVKEVVESSNILFVAVPANKAYNVSRSIIPFLNPEGTGTLYIDVSAASPDVKRKINEEVRYSGNKFVDSAMMGPLTVYQHKIPILASGEGTDNFIKMMSKYKMNISKVSDVAGDASSIKLLRSIFMKGLSSLLIEVLQSAKHFNVETQVVNSIYETMNKEKFEQTLNRLVTGVAIHSERRSEELNGTLKLLKSSNQSSLMTQATQKTLNMITQHNLKDTFKGESPSSWEKVIKELQK